MQYRNRYTIYRERAMRELRHARYNYVPARNRSINNQIEVKVKQREQRFNEILILACIAQSNNNQLPFEIFYTIINFLPQSDIGKCNQLLGGMLIYYNIEQLYKTKKDTLQIRNWQWEKSITSDMSQELNAKKLFEQLSQGKQKITIFQSHEKINTSFWLDSFIDTLTCEYWSTIKQFLLN